MPHYTLVHSSGFTKQLNALIDRFPETHRVWNVVAFSLRENPFVHGLDEHNFGVAFTQSFLRVPPLRVAFRVDAKTVQLIAIEPIE